MHCIVLRPMLSFKDLNVRRKEMQNVVFKDLNVEGEKKCKMLHGESHAWQKSILALQKALKV